MKTVNSYPEFKEALKESEKTYLLLYKEGSEQSDCALTNIRQVSDQMKDLTIYVADVNKVRDIHPVYRITSAPSLLEFEAGEFRNVVKGCNNAGQYKALFEDALYFAEIKKDENPQKRVVVYSTPTCSWCNTLKAYLKLHRIRFTDIDVSRDQRAADELVRRSGQMGVPQTEIGGEIIVGFNKARINELLGIQG